MSVGVSCNFVADVIAISHVADVIAILYVVDGITTEADLVTSC